LAPGERRGNPSVCGHRGRGVRELAAGTLEEAIKTNKTLYRSAVRVALGVALILALPLVAMQITDEVVWSLADFIAAGVLLATIGVALELAVRRASNLAAALGIAALGVAAAVLGEADDAPGLVLLGILLIVSACALGVRTAQR
jgi:peptidoglycan/LPS O-acetylase OafA/YrhL